MCTVTLVGTANATIASDNNGAVGARPVPSQDPTAVSGFQDAPFLTNNNARYGFSLQVTVGNRCRAGDQLKVVLPIGVSVTDVPDVSVEGPTTQPSILTHATTVIVPAAGATKPTFSTTLDTDAGAATRAATMTFTNNATGPDARFDLGVSGGASIGAGGATAVDNTLTVPLTGLHADGNLETLTLSGVRLDLPAGSRNIRVTLTRIADSANPAAPSRATPRLRSAPSTP